MKNEEKHTPKTQPAIQPKAKGRVLIRIVACIFILGLGVFGFRALKNMKKPPMEAATRERRLKVEAIRMSPADYPVTITGYGEITSRTRVVISAEIAGKVVEVHPRLEVGEIIPAGELLFRQDTRDLEVELKSGKARLKTLRRDLALARGEFQRARTLFRQNRVGSLTQVEKLERGVNAVQSQIEQLEKTVQLAEIRLERSVVRAPFTCRLKKVDIEKGQYLSPGRQALVVVDDRNLEIMVPLDSRDASRWLQLEKRADDPFWFGRPQPVECGIEWLENTAITAGGTLERIVEYDPGSRMLRVAVALQRSQPEQDRFPLTEGMFCRVRIPGRTMQGVFALPRTAVDFENRVYLAVDGRLHSTKVETVRREDELVYVGSGLRPGDLFIITRLDNPLEKSLLDMTILDRPLP